MARAGEHGRTLAPRPVAASVEELLAGSTLREPLTPGDSKSSARLERVVIDGQRYMLKYLSLADDWIMRATGDLAARPVVVWESGLLDLVPPSIDHAMVGAARWMGAWGPEAAILMRDVGPWLVPEGDAPLPLEQHLRFLDHMARMHAAFWGWEDTIGLTPLSNRYLSFCPLVEVCETQRGMPSVVPRLIGEGWRRFPERAPRVARTVMALLQDPGPLLDGLRSTPWTFLHGDWKAGNLGSHPDGRTILLDWANPGAGPACADLAWYVALNRARLPHAKEAALDAYRESLERHGVDAAPWWDAQMSLALLGAVVQFGWEKALGDEDELRWWEAAALAGVRYLES